MLKDSFYLRSGNTREPDQELIHGGSIAQIFKKGGKRDACPPKHPSTAYLIQMSFHCVTLFPAFHRIPQREGYTQDVDDNLLFVTSCGR